MTQFMHTFIGCLLVHITWHLFLKKHFVFKKEKEFWKRVMPKF